MSPVVAARALGLRLEDGTQVLDDVTFDVLPGQVVALAGRSGSGKTTVLHLVSGLVRPTVGTVDVAGTDGEGPPPWDRVALLPQASTVAGELTVRENVGLPAALAGRDVPDALFERLGLLEVADRPAAQTSLGEQQRTGLARALVLAPAVALLDEPTSHQDDEHVQLVLSTMVDAGRTGTAVLVASHDARVLEVADVVVRLSGGRVVAG